MNISHSNTKRYLFSDQIFCEKIISFKSLRVKNHVTEVHWKSNARKKMLNIHIKIIQLDADNGLTNKIIKIQDKDFTFGTNTFTYMQHATCICHSKMNEKKSKSNTYTHTHTTSVK